MESEAFAHPGWNAVPDRVRAQTQQVFGGECRWQPGTVGFARIWYLIISPFFLSWKAGPAHLLLPELYAADPHNPDIPAHVERTFSAYGRGLGPEEQHLFTSWDAVLVHLDEKMEH